MAKYIPETWVPNTTVVSSARMNKIEQGIAAALPADDAAPVATSGSYNDLTDKPTIPDEYVLPTATPSTLGGVSPVAKTATMTQPVGVDSSTGRLYTAPTTTTGTTGGQQQETPQITSGNLLDPNALTVGVFVNNNGTINSASTTARISDFIPVSPGETISTGLMKSHTENPTWVTTKIYGYYRQYVFFDSAKTFVSGVFSANNIGGVEDELASFTIPAGVAYVRVTFASIQSVDVTSTPELYFVYKGTPAVSDIYPYGYTSSGTQSGGNTSGGTSGEATADITEKNPYYGKKLVVFGDSIMADCGGTDWQETQFYVGGIGWTPDNIRIPWSGYGFLTRIVREFGIVLENKAVSGTNINQGSNGSYAASCGVNVFDSWIAGLSESDAPEVVLFGFGTNTIKTQIGTMADTSSTLTSVYGATKHIIETMRASLPRTRFGFVLPLETDWSTNINKDAAAGSEAIRTVCQAYKVPYLDMARVSGITLDMLPDGVHPKSIEANTAYFYTLRGWMQAGITAPCGASASGGTGLTPEQEILLESIPNLNNKDVLIIGDSIMHGNGWDGGFANLIAETYPTARITNLSVSGARLVGNGIFDQMSSAYTQGLRPDYILMDGGGNDMFASATLGTVDFSQYADISGATTIVDALEHIFYRARSYLPDTKIIFCTLYKLNPGSSAQIPAFQVQKSIWAEIKKSCEKYSVAVCDFYEESNFLPLENFLSKYFIDVVHINELGYRWLWPMLKAGLLSH